MSDKLVRGWAETLGTTLAGESDEHTRWRRTGKAPVRRAWSEDMAAGKRGSDRGHGALRLKRAFAADPVPPEGDES